MALLVAGDPDGLCVVTSGNNTMLNTSIPASRLAEAREVFLNQGWIVAAELP